MTSRYNLYDDSSIHQLLARLNVDLGPLPTRYNLAPTDQIPVIHQWEGQRLISDMRWWLVPHWCNAPSTDYPMFNARYEQLEDSRAFHGCFRHKRCIIPANSFVEWQHKGQQKTPFLLSAIDQALAFAGIWDYWTNGTEHMLSSAIITTASAPEIETYAPRMPVMLNAANAEIWLDEQQQIPNLFSLFEAVLPHRLQVVEIDAQYSNARDKSAPVAVGAQVILGS